MNDIIVRMSSIYLFVILLFSPFHHQPIDRGYVEVHEIHPGQVRYSRANVEEKVSQAVKEGSVIQVEESYLLKYDRGRSLFPKSKALPVVRGPDGYVLVDGHHHTLVSLRFHAQTIPVKQIADFSQMSSEAFWEKAEAIGLAHIRSLDGEKRIPPKSFFDLENDPGRYFATITCRKYTADLSASRGAEYPLWIKVGKGIPFIELYISDALQQRGIIYDDSMGKSPSAEFVEKARQALVEAEIPGLKVLPKRIHYKDIDKDYEKIFLKESFSPASTKAMLGTGEVFSTRLEK